MAFTLLWNKISPLRFLRNITLCTFTKISWILNRLLMEKNDCRWFLDWTGSASFQFWKVKRRITLQFFWSSQSVNLSSTLVSEESMAEIAVCPFQLHKPIKKARRGYKAKKKKKRLVVSITRSCIINSCPHAFFFFPCSLALLEPMSLCMQPLGEHGELCTTSTVHNIHSAIQRARGTVWGKLKATACSQKEGKTPRPRHTSHFNNTGIIAKSLESKCSA